MTSIVCISGRLLKILAEYATAFKHLLAFGTQRCVRWRKHRGTSLALEGKNPVVGWYNLQRAGWQFPHKFWPFWLLEKALDYQFKSLDLIQEKSLWAKRFFAMETVSMVCGESNSIRYINQFDKIWPKYMKIVFIIFYIFFETIPSDAVSCLYPVIAALQNAKWYYTKILPC